MLAGRGFSKASKANYVREITSLIWPVRFFRGKAFIVDEGRKRWLKKVIMWFRRWFISVNHKDIGTLYILSGVWAGMIGISLRFIIRLELAHPGAIILGRSQLYNRFVTLHGIIMIFFLIIPIMMGGLGN